MAWPIGAGDKLVVPARGGIVIFAGGGGYDQRHAAKAEWVPASVVTRINVDSIFLKSMGDLSGSESERGRDFPAAR
ncbi:hypothetical protein BK637_18725 [Pseudomonas chlororaphis]|nr:hypothetical protein BK637_18725 [Pseudomonas chlororaphis]